MIVIPAQAGIQLAAGIALQSSHSRREPGDILEFVAPWVPAFAGMTEKQVLGLAHPDHDGWPSHTGLPSGPTICFQLSSTALTTLAGIKLGLKRYERSRIDGQWLQRDEILKISDDIVSRDFEGRAAIPCVGTDRADLILPGCAILGAIMDNWPCGTLRVADRGLREGILIALLRESERPS